MTEKLALYLWFFHRELFLSLPGSEARTVREKSRRWLNVKRGNELHEYSIACDRWLHEHDVPSLEVALLRGEANPGQLVWCEADWEWSRVAAERRATEAGQEVRSEFRAQVTVSEVPFNVFGRFNPAHLTSSSSNSELAGIRLHYVLAQIAVATPETVELRPIAIATRLFGPPETEWFPTDWQFVSPQQVDQFAGVNWEHPVSIADLAALRDIPEMRVKQVLAQMIGEAVVPKDWGGEQFDLWTTRLRVDGHATPTAFLLKGPAKFAPMTIAMLGKNGDQTDRMCRSAARMVVVQHSHEIRPEVVSMLRAYASDYRDPRRYMLIDGFDTYRILRAVGEINL